MRVLFVHDECPGQFKHLAPALASDPANRVVFLARHFTSRPRGTQCRRWRRARLPSAASHPYLLPLEGAVSAGEGAYDACARLKRDGFRPDVICAHAGFGPGLYLKEIFPDVPVLGYFEWLYRGPGRDGEYLSGQALPGEVACRARTRNAGILLELASCDLAVTPTKFQRLQFPSPLREKLEVIHDGVDTAFYRPDPAVGGNRFRAALPQGAQVLTYATRGMEPMRGFPQFMAATAALISRRPNLHVLIAGEDRAAYSPGLASGRTYREQAIAEYPELACDRVRFLGRLQAPDYRDLLCASDVHVYLTAPFVLSWSLLEAMSCACLVVAADTAPVTKVMRDGQDGLLVDFRDPARLAARIGDALDGHADYQRLGQSARRRVVEQYRVSRQIRRQMALIERLVARSPVAIPVNGRDRRRTVAGTKARQMTDDRFSREAGNGAQMRR